MLKSDKIGDHYRNVNLSNLKLLSTTRNTCASLADRHLRYIDETIRDIEALNCGDDTVSEEVETFEEVVEQPKELKEKEYCDTPSSNVPEIPILLSIQYNNYQDVVGAVEGFLKDRQQAYHPGFVPMNACRVCQTVEMTHAEKLAELSVWRTTVMAQLNLKTTAFTD